MITLKHNQHQLSIERHLVHTDCYTHELTQMAPALVLMCHMLMSEV